MMDQLAALASQEAPDARAARDQLILSHLTQVRIIARQLHEGAPGAVNLDDLISAGILGLIAAIDNYDPSQQVKLKTYAEYKIRGAMLDSLRELDWASRTQRRRAREIEHAIAELECGLRRNPTEDEIAAHLKVPLARYQNWLADLRGLSIATLETVEGEDSVDLLRYIADDAELWPSRVLERAELERLIVRSLAEIPETERNVLSLYYYEDLTLREIGKIIGVHESRVSQIKAQALLRLRTMVERHWPVAAHAAAS